MEEKPAKDNKHPSKKEEVKQDEKKPKEKKSREQKPKRQRKGSKNRYRKRRNLRGEKRMDKHIEVTLETEIPPMPSKSEILKRPSERKLHKAIDKIEDQIQELHDIRREYIKRLNKQKKDLNQIDDIKTLKEMKDAKFDEKKKIQHKFNSVTNQKKKFDKEID